MRAVTLEDVVAARSRIEGTVLRTPLVPLDLDGPGRIWLKLETLQPVRSFKIRGAANAVARLDPATAADGVFTASAGNMALALAWTARGRRARCTVVAPDHAPRAKLDPIERLGASVTLVPFDRWWRVLEERSFDGASGHFVHPFLDPDVVAGNGTIALEVLEDCPDVDSVIVPYGGGGLATGIGTVFRALRPSVKVFAAEPETAAPLAASLAAGRPTAIRYKPSFVDGAGGKTVFAEMWPHVSGLLVGSITVPVARVADAIRLLLERTRVLAEGAGALGLAAALSREDLGPNVVVVISGGNIDSRAVVEILEGRVPR